MVWVRDLEGTKNPEDDAIRFYYISSYVQVDYGVTDSLLNRCTGG